MFNAEGVSPETDDKLVPGKYECFAGGRYTFMDMAKLLQGPKIRLNTDGGTFYATTCELNKSRRSDLPCAMIEG